jgi:NAD+ synthase
MTATLTMALAQINPTVGDVEGNARKIRDARARAARLGADIVITPELSLPGYPPEDLVLKPMFLDAVDRALQALAAETADGGPGLVVGVPWREGAFQGRGYDRSLAYNAAVVLDGGKVQAVRYKYDLPNYSVFDEKRVFKAGPLPGPVNFRGVRLGLMVCEDMWTSEVSECLMESGAEILVVPNGSPFQVGKSDFRVSLAVARVTETGLPLVYVNQVGGQDELVFDGGSFVIGARHKLRAQMPEFAEHLTVVRWRHDEGERWICSESERMPPFEGPEAIYQAMMLGLRDYVNKNGFPGVIIGLSGGIDSALTAVVAVDALGAGRVRCVMMPSPYTSRASLDDAAECARLLDCRLDTVPIGPAMEAFGAMLAPVFAGREANTTEENIQARARGITLMALSNKFGDMVLSTGNKSEMSVGYATLYGDMCGGFSVLKDIYKTTIYRLARWRNQAVPANSDGPAGRVIPERILTRAPSAELKPDQTDQDSLPPYETLDDILHGLIEQELPVDDIVARGHDRAVVNRVWRMLENAEYKRRQAPPGVKITARAFGRDRRYPITNAYKGPG